MDVKRTWTNMLKDMPSFLTGPTDATQVWNDIMNVALSDANRDIHESSEFKYAITTKEVNAAKKILKNCVVARMVG